MVKIATFTSRAASSLLAMPSKLTQINGQILMKRLRRCALVAVITSAAGLPNLIIISSAATKSTPAQTAAGTAPAPELDPGAVATLNKMGAYLRTLKP